MKNLIIKPLVTEKNTIHNAAGIYVFKVVKSATKGEIKAEVEKSFGVQVDRVRTMICRGHTKMTKFGPSKVPYWKKAFVQLKAGEKIALFDGV
jgi:large subunit ribosomal protein L23